MFRICEVIDSELDIQTFFSAMSEFFSLLAQFDQVINIDGVCNLMLNNTEASEVEAVASVVEYLLAQLEDEPECVNIDYEYAVESDRQTSWNSTAAESGFRQYTYMECTQFGWYHSSSSRFQPFGSRFPLSLRLQACADVFPETFSVEKLDRSIVSFNTMRGGVRPAATNILYVHGQLDPWRSVGIQDTIIESSPVIVIEGASQGNDLGTVTDQDTEAVEAAKDQIREIISQWIRDAGGVVPYPTPTPQTAIPV